jgi:SH3 domain protein
MIDVRATAAAFALLFAVSGQAQRMYVTDEIVITLRSGPSTQNTVLANLRTGDAVEVLEQDAGSGYSRIRTIADDAQGWVLTRYLMSEPTSDARLASTQEELTAARQRISGLEADLTEATQALTGAQSALVAAEGSHRDVSAELAAIRDASANVLELEEHNESLRQRNLELSTELDALVAEANRLGDRSRQNWFVVGSLVLAFGIVIGLVAPSLRMRRRSKW